MPALCGSLLAPCVYKILLQLKLSRWIAVLGGLLIIFGEYACRSMLVILALEHWKEINRSQLSIPSSQTMRCSRSHGSC